MSSRSEPASKAQLWLSLFILCILIAAGLAAAVWYFIPPAERSGSSAAVVYTQAAETEPAEVLEEASSEPAEVIERSAPPQTEVTEAAPPSGEMSGEPVSAAAIAASVSSSVPLGSFEGNIGWRCPELSALDVDRDGRRDIIRRLKIPGEEGYTFELLLGTGDRTVLLKDTGFCEVSFLVSDMTGSGKDEILAIGKLEDAAGSSLRFGLFLYEDRSYRKALPDCSFCMNDLGSGSIRLSCPFTGYKEVVSLDLSSGAQAQLSGNESPVRYFFGNTSVTDPIVKDILTDGSRLIVLYSFRAERDGSVTDNSFAVVWHVLANAYAVPERMGTDVAADYWPEPRIPIEPAQATPARSFQTDGGITYVYGAPAPLAEGFSGEVRFRSISADSASVELSPELSFRWTELAALHYGDGILLDSMLYVENISLSEAAEGIITINDGRYTLKKAENDSGILLDPQGEPCRVTYVDDLALPGGTVLRIGSLEWDLASFLSLWNGKPFTAELEITGGRYIITLPGDKEAYFS